MPFRFHFGLPSIAPERPGFQTAAHGGLATAAADGVGVRQSLALLLATTPGERCMRPEYGCKLHHLAFEPVDDTTAGLAIHYVRSAITRWEPRVRIISLDAGPDPDRPECLLISLRYCLADDPEASDAQLQYSLSEVAP